MGQVYAFLLDTGSPRQSQRNALLSAGCGEIWFQTRFSLELIDGLNRGDRLLVWRIDELELSIQEVIEMISRLTVQGIGFTALVDNIDTGACPAINEFCLALTTMRRRNHSKSTVAGIKRAQSAGHPVGRSRKLSPSDIEVIDEAVRSREITIAEAARQFGINRNTLQRYLSEARSNQSALEVRLTREHKLSAASNARPITKTS